MFASVRRESVYTCLCFSTKKKTHQIMLTYTYAPPMAGFALKRILLDRIIELEETQANSNMRTSPAFTSSSSSSSSLSSEQPDTGSRASAAARLPRALQSEQARASFIENLRQAFEEDDLEDEVDPVLRSRHVGALDELMVVGRKGSEEEEEGARAREQRKSGESDPQLQPPNTTTRQGE